MDLTGFGMGASAPPWHDTLDVVVLGLGNRLRRDEGLGVCAIERLLSRYALAPGVRLVDGGTLGLDLLAYVEGARKLLVLDATLADAEPGSLVRLEGPAVPAYFGRNGSSHDIGLPDLLAATRLRGTEPEEVVVLGLQPHTVELGWDLSPSVARGLDALVEAAVAQLTAWGFPATARETVEEGVSGHA